jgi:hypothetical protein
MALRDVKAFGKSFDLVADREKGGVRVAVEQGGHRVWTVLWDGREPVVVNLGVAD